MYLCRAVTVLVVVLYGLIAPVIAKAVAIEVAGVPDTVNEDEAFEFDISFSGDKKYYANGTYYFRAVFFPLDSSQYFGFIENNAGDWGNNYSDKSTLYRFTTNEEGSFSARLRARADVRDPSFNGAGEYGFKVGRYTEKGGSAAPWSPTTVVFINYTPPATPPPTPQPTDPPPSSSTPPPTPKSTPKVTPKASPVTAGKPTPVTHATGSASASGSGEVLGEKTYDLTGIAETTPSSKSADRALSSKIVPLVILFGSVLTTGAAIPFGMKFLASHEE